MYSSYACHQQTSDRALVGLSSKLSRKTDHSGNPSYLLWFHYQHSGLASHQDCIFREDGDGVLRGPELGGVALQPYLPQARRPGPPGPLVQE